MSWVHRLMRILVPPATAARIEEEWRQWRMRCPEGHEQSVWDAGGIRYGAARNPRRRAFCPQCNATRWHQLYRRR